MDCVKDLVTVTSTMTNVLMSTSSSTRPAIVASVMMTRFGGSVKANITSIKNMRPNAGESTYISDKSRIPGGSVTSEMTVK